MGAALCHKLTVRAAFDDFIRGEKGSTAEHLSCLQYEIQQDKKRLEAIKGQVEKETLHYEDVHTVHKTFMEIEHMGKKTLTGKVTISSEDFNDLSTMAKQSVAARSKIFDLVDENKIALTPADELSYLTDEQQYALLGTIEEEDRTPSISQAVRFKKLSQAGELTDEQIESIMFEAKANQKPTFKLPMEKLQEVAPKVKDKDFVLKACEHYYRYLQRQQDRDAR